jgi:hypothetical protein
MLDYDDVIDGLIVNIVEEYELDRDNNDIYDIIHEFVDLEVSGNHYLLNKRIIEEVYDKDIFEVLKDYSDEYGDMDLSVGKVNIYARLAYFAIINYGTFREDIEERVEEINDKKSAATTEEEY